MTVTVPWHLVEAARFIGCAFLLGAALGAISALVRGERHG